MTEPSGQTRDTPSDTLLGVEGVVTLAGFVLRAVNRRRRVALLCFSATIAMAGLALAITPRSYKVDARILSRPSYIMPGLTHPGRSIPIQAQQGTRGAVELVKSRENLAGIIADTKMLDSWKETRTGIGRVMDFLRTLVAGPIAEDDLHEALLELLDDKLWASVENEVIIITSNWHDPVTALEIVKAAQQRFLEDQFARELSEIRETIGVIESSLSRARTDLETAAERLEAAAGSSRGVQRVRRSPSASSSDSPSAATSEALELEREVTVRRQEIANTEASYSQRVRQAQNRLNDLRTALGPRHPDVVNAVRELEMQSIPPESLTTLRREEARMSQQLRRTQGSSVPPSHREILDLIPMGQSVDPELERAMQGYRSAETVFSDLTDRYDNAQMELHAAEVGFTYRFTVTLPPVLPRQPDKPKAKQFILAGIMVAFFLAILLAVAFDIMTGRIQETWQIRHLVGIPLLGELDEPNPHA